MYQPPTNGMSEAANAKLVFLHIPKTGGSTLRKIIDRQYPANQTLRCYYQKQGISLRQALQEIGELPYEQTAAVKIILGHVGHGIHEHLPWPCHYFTILRDPVERFLSGYYHIHRDNSHPFQSSVRKMALKEFIASEELKVEAVRLNAVNALDNLQTRLLSGTMVNTELASDSSAFEPCTTAMFEKAKMNLDGCLAVGISERFDDSVMLFKKRLGWSNVFYRKSNVGWNRTPRERLSSDTIKALEAYNSVDLELYSYAKRQFERAIADQGLIFKSKSASYKLLNRTYGEALRASGAIEKRLLQRSSAT